MQSAWVPASYAFFSAIGAAVGERLGERWSHPILGAAAGAAAGALIAKQFVGTVFPQQYLSGLGDVPSGFYEELGPWRYTTDPVFTRGVLVPIEAWADQTRAMVTGAPSPSEKFLSYPRYTLYGGPTGAAYVSYVEEWLKKWASSAGMRYESEEPALLVPPKAIGSKWPHSDFRFYQLLEKQTPRHVTQGQKNGTWGWHY